MNCNYINTVAFSLPDLRPKKKKKLRFFELSLLKLYRTAHSNYEITLERESSYERYFQTMVKRFFLRHYRFNTLNMINQQEDISVKRYCMSFKRHFVQNICNWFEV